MPVLRRFLLGFTSVLLPVSLFASPFKSENQASLFQVGKNEFKATDLTASELSRIYEMDIAKYRYIESLAKQRYVSEQTKSFAHLNTEERPFAAEEKWLKKSFEPKKSELAAAFEQLKGERQLESLSEAEKRKVIKNYLTQQNRVRALTQATDDALLQGTLKLAMELPVAPLVQFNPSTQVALGEVGAPVRIVEFTDFQCPYCKKFSAVAKDVLNKYGKQIQWEVRHYPLSFHKQARPAATAVYCASEQGKLMDAKEWIFNAQDRLADESVFSDMQNQLKLEKESFERCLKSEKAKSVIMADLKEAERVGVSGTPTVFVNGRKFEGDVQSIQAWDKLLMGIVKTQVR